LKSQRFGYGRGKWSEEERLIYHGDRHKQLVFIFMTQISTYSIGGRPRFSTEMEETMKDSPSPEINGKDAAFSNLVSIDCPNALTMEDGRLLAAGRSTVSAAGGSRPFRDQN